MIKNFVKHGQVVEGRQDIDKMVISEVYFFPKESKL
jgi:hypothetical protein